MSLESEADSEADEPTTAGTPSTAATGTIKGAASVGAPEADGVCLGCKQWEEKFKVMQLEHTVCTLHLKSEYQTTSLSPRPWLLHLPSDSLNKGNRLFVLRTCSV